MPKITTSSPYFGKPPVVRIPYLLGHLQCGSMSHRMMIAVCRARQALGQVGFCAVGFVCLPMCLTCSVGLLETSNYFVLSVDVKINSRAENICCVKPPDCNNKFLMSLIIKCQTYAKPHITIIVCADTHIFVDDVL